MRFGEFAADRTVGVLKTVGANVTFIVVSNFAFGGKQRPTRSVASVSAIDETRPSLQSLIHSGLRQAASAFRKTLNLEGRNFRFE